MLLLRRLHLGVLPPEPFHSAGGIQQLLLARKEGMAIRADFNVDVSPMGRARRKAVAARAHDADFVISGMDRCFHDFRTSTETI